MNGRSGLRHGLGANGMTGELQFSALMSVVTKNLSTMSSIITGAR